MSKIRIEFFQACRVLKISKGLLYKNPFELTFSSLIKFIPDRLLSSRACFRLIRHHKSTKVISMFKKIYTFVKNCKAMAGLKQKCKVMAGLKQKICKVFLGRDSLMFIKVIYFCTCRTSFAELLKKLSRCLVRSRTSLA